MHKPRLIASDVDGTLLDATERLSMRTKATIRNAVADGTPVVLVSGRPPRWIPAVASAAELVGYAVCANGAVLYDIATDRVARAHSLDPVLLSDVAKALSDIFPECRLSAERIGSKALEPEMAHFVVEENFRNPWGDSMSTRATRAEVLGRPAVKLLCSMDGMTSDEMAIAAGAVLDGSVDVTFSSGSGLIEIVAHGVNKATGLAEVADLVGVETEEIIAFGDMPNDVEMLRWVGHGVAMGNSHPAVLDVADELTAPNSEDGVAQVLERWF